ATTCPPNRSPAASARSRFTRPPRSSRESVERRSVSGETSKASVSSPAGSIVRQTPDTAMLSPGRASVQAGGRSRARSAPGLLGETEATFAVAETRPVNIAAPVCLKKASRRRDARGEPDIGPEAGHLERLEARGLGEAREPG